MADQTQHEQRDDEPKTPREIAREHMCDVLVKAYRESEQKGEKQAR